MWPSEEAYLKGCVKAALILELDVLLLEQTELLPEGNFIRQNS